MDKSGTIETKNLEETRIWLRQEMPVSCKWAYFDHAAVGPLPERTRQTIDRWGYQATEEGDAAWGDWSANAEQLRLAGARLLGAHRDEIAIISNTTIGINLIAQGLRWQLGDNMVVPENEFPSNLLPWLNLERRGVEVRRLAVPPSGVIDLAELSRLIDGRTRLVAMSWVGFASGFRAPIAQVCELVHRQGAKFLVDAIQGLGVFDLDVRTIPADFIVADGHKWMLGPEGVGLMYVRNELLDELDPVIVGWASVNNSQTFSASQIDLKRNAGRFEFGSYNMAGIAGLRSSLELLLEANAHARQIGSDSVIGELVLDHAEQLVEQLLRIGCTVHSPKHREWMSGIVAFDCPGVDNGRVRGQLLERGVNLSVRNGHIRASGHAYNNQEDRMKLIEALEDIRRRGS